MSGSAVANEELLGGVAKVLGLPDAAALGELRPSTLWNRTQRELLEAARLLGLVKVSKLNKEALLARVWEALDGAGAFNANGGPAAAPSERTNGSSHAPPAAHAREEAPREQATREQTREDVEPAGSLDAPTVRADEVDESPPAAAHKFEVGGRMAVDLSKLRAEAQSHIPWGYARDRVTAMPVNPERLFVYWEVTDAAMAAARAGLGAAGKDAWLALRVYDITGRIFDGTNAHAYFDHNIERGDRQWFFEIGKPTSQAVVDIGMKSREGYFVKIARSARVEFPPRGPAGWSEPEWMTVRLSTGEAWSGQGPPPAPPAPGAAGAAGGGGGGGGGAAGAAAGQAEDFAAVFALGAEGGELRRRLWEERVSREDGAFEERVTWEEMSGSELPTRYESWSWDGGSEITSWTAGPFSYPVEAPPLTRETYVGPTRVFRSGPRTHVMWGPWQLVIRGLGAHAEHRVIARWEVYRAWTSSAWREVAGSEGVMPGSSELRAGASERWGRAGSELRLRGSSERYVLGASEVRLGGASERAFLGGTEVAMRGASERRWIGASELRFGGASERRLGGASELRLGGASEQRLGGGSELRLGGGSEGRLGGASEQHHGGTESESYDESARGAGSGESPPVLWPRLGNEARK
jgi:hypothetical protein